MNNCQYCKDLNDTIKPMSGKDLVCDECEDKKTFTCELVGNKLRIFTKDESDVSDLRHWYFNEESTDIIIEYPGVKHKTDLQKLKAVFDDIGVEYCERKEDGEVHGYGSPVFKADKSLHLRSGMGYSGFYCDMFFLDGEYKGHGVWE